MTNRESPELQVGDRSDESSLRMPVVIKALLLAWMGANAFIFVAVSISPDWPIATVLPEFMLRARHVLLPLFIN